MQCFQENYCRLCPKRFCCKKCRSDHEERFHEVNPECEICIYGRMTIKDASVGLLNHIKSTHWPLHCVFCKKVFDSLDELIPHEKCSAKTGMMNNMQTPTTPVTPVNENNEPSPMITPFYKVIPDGKVVISTIAMAVSSTPLVPKEENDDGDKITPLNSSDLKFIYKSSIKLTGSSNLSDSKKSERRVTFSETPSVTDPPKKSKYLPLLQQITNKQREIAENSSDCESPEHSYGTVEDEGQLYKTVSSSLSKMSEETENDENRILMCNRIDSDVTTEWESAVTHLGSETVDTNENVSNHFNVSMQINVFNNTLKSDEDSNVHPPDVSLNKSLSIWSSVTNMVKSVMNNISFTTQSTLPISTGIKRSTPETGFQSEVPSYKRMKLTDLKCRRSIRNLSPLCQIRLGRPACVDKATQTDETWL